MLHTTVADFASELRKSPETLLEQLSSAGVAKTRSSDLLTDADKQRLLAHLQASHGAAADDRRKIILVKKSASEISSSASRTIQVEVHKKRTFVKREESAEVPPEAPPVSVTAAVAAAPTGGMGLASDEQEVAALMTELGDALDRIQGEIAQNQKTKEELGTLQKKLEERGWWGAVFGSSADKELTTQVLALSRSVGTTQEFVRIMLKVQTKKDRVLQGFVDALAKKIAEVQGGVHIVQGDQVATLLVLGELRQQVQEQIRQREQVRRHGNRLQDHEEVLTQLAEAHVETDRLIAKVHGAAAALQERVEASEQWQLDRERHDADSARHVATIEAGLAMLGGRCAELEAWRRGQDAGVLALREQLQQSQAHAGRLEVRIGGLEGRLAQLESTALQASSMQARLLRQVPAFIAVALAAAALIRVMV